MSSWVYNNYTDGPTAGNRIPELELHSMMYPFLPNLLSNQLLGFCLTYYINSICNYVQHYQSWPVVSMWHWLCPSTLLSQPTRSPNDSTAVVPSARVPTLSSQSTIPPNVSTAEPSTVRVPTLLSQLTTSPSGSTAVPSTGFPHSSQPTSSTKSNSALGLDSYNITVMLVLLACTD